MLGNKKGEITTKSWLFVKIGLSSKYERFKHLNLKKQPFDSKIKLKYLNVKPFIYMGIKNDAGYFKNNREIHSFAKTEGKFI